MRQSLLRRIVAAVFVLVGVAVASGATHAEAAPAPASGTHHVAPADWEW